MANIQIIEKAIREGLDKYAEQLQEDLQEKYAKEFERRLESKRREIAANVIGMITVEEDLNRMQIIVHMK